MQYEYSFRLWIDGKENVHPEIIGNVTKEVLNLSLCRVSYILTETEFKTLRERLWNLGFDMHEIERIPFFERENIL